MKATLIVVALFSKCTLGKGTNWQRRDLSTGVPIISHDFSGGSDKITYSVSGSHLDQEGIVGGDKSDF
jgi:hypothetical protein